MASANDIVASAQQQLTALQAINSSINTRIAAIKDAEWNASLTDQEIGQINALRAQQQPILSAIEELSYVTLGALDQSDEISRMGSALAGVVKGLDAQAAQIAAIDASAKNISGVSKAIAGLIPQIQALAK